MFFILILIVFSSSSSSETIKHLHEISINEELPINSIVTFLTDKIPNLDQSQEYDLVTPLSPKFDLFTVDHHRRALIVKQRIDFEQICSLLSNQSCIISVSIAVANRNTIDVYILPIRIFNIDDNPVRFLTNRTVIEIEENDPDWSRRTFPLSPALDIDNDPIHYSLFLYNWSLPTGLFELVDNSPGNLSLRPMRSFDREQQHLYALRLLAHSGRKHQQSPKIDEASMDIIVIIKDINDNSPQCEQNRTEFILNNFHSISTILINATDRDEGENGKLEYFLVNPLSSFHLDRYSGLLKFDSNKWIPTNESFLIVNISDHGKPRRLSTQCRIELKFTFLFDIEFQTDNGSSNETIFIPIRDVQSPLGHLIIMDDQQHSPCFDCLIRLSSALPDLFTDDFHFNLSSKSLLRILTNPSPVNEDLSLLLTIDTYRPQMPAIISTRQILFFLHFDKQYLSIHSNLIFLQINNNMELKDKIITHNILQTHCQNQSTQNLILIDESQTFEMDIEGNLIVKTYFNIQQQQIYELLIKTNELENFFEKKNASCSIQLRILVIDPYASDAAQPYFPEPFYILSGNVIRDFALPILPAHVHYVSSVPDSIAIDSRNGSIDIRSSSLFNMNYYDFEIRAIDSRTPSLSTTVPVRIFFGLNHQAPRLMATADTLVRRIQIPSSGYLGRIQAYDPDLSPNDSRKMLPPSIEYQLDAMASLSSIEIELERFSGRIFIKRPERSIFPSSFLNLTILMIDFGQSRRLSTRHTFIFDLNWTNEMSQLISTSLTTSFVLIGAGILVLVIILSAILLIFNSCCSCYSPMEQRSPSNNVTIKKKSNVSTHQTNWKNISPTAPDTRLIDNEYITNASLPRITTREQRVYPTLTFEHQNHRRLLFHSSLEKINNLSPPLYSSVYIKPDHLSMTDINKYLERFEKIYNDSSPPPTQHLHGSVV